MGTKPITAALHRRIIIVIGTDGSGKSTLSNRLVHAVPKPRTYVYFGLKGARLPLVHHFYRRYGDVSTIARLLLFPLDYHLRQRALPKQGYIILDRLPGWAVLTGTPLIRWLYRKVLPACDTLVLCTGDPEVIVTRKPERTISECKADMVKWQAVFDSYPARKKVLLDTTRNDIETCVSQAAGAILTGLTPA